MSNDLLEQIINKSLESDISTQEELLGIEKEVCSKASANFPTKMELLEKYRDLLGKEKISKSVKLEKLLVKKQVRTISGVAPVAIFTKPYQCPGDCHFCPTQEEIPKSYLDNEPAVMRAIRNDYHPIKQVWDRLEALTLEGHPTDKIELIVMGGSFSNYPDGYKVEFIKQVFWAANNYSPGISKKKGGDYDDNASLEELQSNNEKANNRIIGLSVETRPDLVDKNEIRLWRKLGVTRAELGVQILDEKVLKLNNRGHGLDEIRQATKLLRDNGFKLIYHLMPGLPGSNPTNDIEKFKKVFSDPAYKPDQIKIYPCVVTKGAKIYQWYKEGKFKPYSSKVLVGLLSKMKRVVPRWVRIIRVIRDIPSQMIEGGSKVNNLRQVVNQNMAKKGWICNCIRCREVKTDQDKNIRLFVNKYRAAGGEEVFFSYENKQRTNLYGILRLRIPSKDSKPLFSEIKNSALIRELHVYGPSQQISKKDKQKPQHRGIGKKLMEVAERYVGKRTSYRKISVISGVGVRYYYRKLNYKLEGTYMVKNLS